MGVADFEGVPGDGTGFRFRESAAGLEEGGEVIAFFRLRLEQCEQSELYSQMDISFYLPMWAARESLVVSTRSGESYRSKEGPDRRSTTFVRPSPTAW